MKSRSAAGFSLLEMIIVMAIVLTISAAIFQVINLVTERSSTEQVKLDMFQEAREFMDQMTRDLRQAGYPNARNYSSTISPAMASPASDDSRVAVGLVKIDAGELWFEGDVDGTGTVSVIRYFLDTSTTTNCPCLRRSQLPKNTGNPITANTITAYQVEVQGVTNTAALPIFSAYNNGVAQTLPLDFNTNPTTIASIDTIQAVLSLQAATIDPKTKTKPTTTLITTVRLNNCSLAAPGKQTSCF